MSCWLLSKNRCLRLFSARRYFLNHQIDSLLLSSSIAYVEKVRDIRPKSRSYCFVSKQPLKNVRFYVSRQFQLADYFFLNYTDVLDSAENWALRKRTGFPGG